jgi:tetratricopeptide (TPR) repeat protein
MPPVSVRRETLVLPTYVPHAPDRNPMFLESRVYQGSSGRVYPLPFCDRIAGEPVSQPWETIVLENEFLAATILPALGGRIHRLVDKTNSYDVIYYQPVIKPALVGLAGPWISGGIEFNWPQHHRPSTFMPAEAHIEQHGDGAVTVWLSEHDPMARMKGMHGVCLRPGHAVLELRARVYNRTADTQTFLWWANVATRVHEHYQSFFPPDATYVADHAKRAMSAFPRCAGRYYGVDYAARARLGVPAEEAPRLYRPPGDSTPDDLSWYANIPVPTSYMCMGTEGDFFGGYDHRAEAGIVHVADHHIAPGKKQWTWGNHEFGYAWDRNLTDADENGEHRPYIELMAGVYTDNQPDFSFLTPGETKTWTQHWYPIRAIGPAHAANTDAALSLRVDGSSAHLGVAVTAVHAAARVRLERRGRALAEFTRDLSPAQPLVERVSLPRGARAIELTLIVATTDGRELLRYTPITPRSPTASELATQAATEPAAPANVASNDELYLIGLHLEQYRHATRLPEQYWREVLRRDPGDSRCHLALGRWHLRRGELPSAERHLRASIARLTHRNPNPADGEAHYQLSRCLVLRWFATAPAPDDTRSPLLRDAYAAAYKATWNHAWQSSGFHLLAQIDCLRHDWNAAHAQLERALRLNTDHLAARNLQAIVLRKLGREAEAQALLEQNLALDPLDAWSLHLLGRTVPGDTQMRFDLALDYARAGFYGQALDALADAAPAATEGTAPLLGYYRAWLCRRAGRPTDAARHLAAARAASPDYCFPARLEEIAILESAIAAAPTDARAPFYLGNLLYDRRRHREAIAQWERAVRLEPANAVAWRNLGLARFNVQRLPARARRAYDAAFRAAPADARLLYERDQLWKRTGALPGKRLRELERHPALVRSRDDLSIELCALYNQTGRPELALPILRTRKFQPWEGGEGLALGLHVRTHLQLGRAALARGDAPAAIACFDAALEAPANLGEARHLLANASDVRFWLGEALAAAGLRADARQQWRAAATFRGDFQAMSVKTFSELTYYSALAWRRLGRPAKAAQLLRELLAYARQLAKAPANIDYFATSLPTMLLFEDDLAARQQTTAIFLEAQAQLGLGDEVTARRLLAQVLQRDPNHALACDLVTASPSFE